MTKSKAEKREDEIRHTVVYLRRICDECDLAVEKSKNSPKNLGKSPLRILAEKLVG